MAEDDFGGDRGFGGGMKFVLIAQGHEVFMQNWFCINKIQRSPTKMMLSFMGVRGMLDR
jgi:hypothetical protein